MLFPVFPKKRRNIMKRTCAFALLLFLFTAGNCFAVKFNQIELYSSNWGGSNWGLGTDLFLDVGGI